MENFLSRIEIRPDVRSGKPCVKGTRMTIQDVLEYLASGMSEAQVLEDFPYITHLDVLACLQYAAQKERTVVLA